MSDPVQDPPAPSAGPETPPAEPPAEPAARPTVPLSELQQVRREKKQLQDRLAALEAEAEDRRKAEMSEVDRHKADAEEARRTAAELQDKLSRTERESWLRAAAQKAGFIDPEDAIARIGTGDLEDEKQARDAVKDLANRAKHLIAQRNQDPRLHEVLKNGEATDPKAGDSGPKPPKYSLDDIKAMSPDQIRGDLEEVNRSLAAHSAG